MAEKIEYNSIYIVSYYERPAPAFIESNAINGYVLISPDCEQWAVGISGQREMIELENSGWEIVG